MSRRTAVRTVAAAASLALLAALALRLAPASIGRSWSIDELITRNTACLPVWKSGWLDAPHPASHSILAFCLHDTGPGPLAYLLDGALARWAEPLGREWLLRLPGVVAGMLAAVGAFVCGRRWFAGLAAAPAMAVTVGLAAPCIAWSTGARGYAWAVLLTLAQMDLLVWLGRLSGTRRQTCTVRWALFCLLAAAGYFLHPFQGAFTLACVAALVCVRMTLRGTRIARVKAPLFWGGLVMAALAAISWTVPWLLRATKGLPAGPRGSFLSQLAGGILGGPHGLPFLAMAVASLAIVTVLACACRARPLRAPAIAGLVSVAAAWILYGALRGRFFMDLRYFHFLAAPTAWLLGHTCMRSEAIVRRLAGAPMSRAVTATVPWLLAVALLPAAIAASRSVVSDWAGAVRWLQPRMAPGDIVVCGPNSDGEVFSAYADAAGLKATPVRWFNDTDGVRYDAWTTDGMTALLRAPNRLWFVTSFWGHVRPTAYWQKVSEHFGEAAIIPGRFRIQIRCRPALLL